MRTPRTRKAMAAHLREVAGRLIATADKCRAAAAEGSELLGRPGCSRADRDKADSIFRTADDAHRRAIAEADRAKAMADEMLGRGPT